MMITLFRLFLSFFFNWDQRKLITFKKNPLKKNRGGNYKGRIFDRSNSDRNQKTNVFFIQNYNPTITCKTSTTHITEAIFTFSQYHIKDLILGWYHDILTATCL